MINFLTHEGYAIVPLYGPEQPGDVVLYDALDDGHISRNDHLELYYENGLVSSKAGTEPELGPRTLKRSDFMNERVSSIIIRKQQSSTVVNFKGSEELHGGVRSVTNETFDNIEEKAANDNYQELLDNCSYTYGVL